MSNPAPPITAIVIFHNERELLEPCLAALGWCDELIAVDMASTDGSADIARRFTDRIYRVPRYPIAEPTRVAAARLASHDWILLVDPDEVMPARLVPAIRRTLANHPDAAAIQLPMRFYFKRKLLTGTVWGTPVAKRRLIHRDRCRLLPLCNRITELFPGERDVTIPHQPRNHIRHYWSNSYADLLRKHLSRYPKLEAKAFLARGQSLSPLAAIRLPFTELRRSLKDFDGWRMGARGFLLSCIYFLYTVAWASCAVLYQHRPLTAQPVDIQLPTLIPDAVQPLQARSAA